MNPESSKSLTQLRQIRDEFQLDLKALETGSLAEAKNQSSALLTKAIEQLDTQISLIGSDEHSKDPTAGQSVPSEDSRMSPIPYSAPVIDAPIPEVFRTLAEEFEVQPPSGMDPAALNKETPVGRISPPVTRRFFICDSPRLPLPNGFAHRLSPDPDYNEASPRAAAITSEEIPERQEVTIEIPANSGFTNGLPVPFDYGIVLCDHPVARDERATPYVWSPRKDKSIRTFCYAIAPTEKKGLRLSELQALSPSNEESVYWQQMLGIPTDLMEEARRLAMNPDGRSGPNSALDIISHWMSHINQESGQSNFRYVNHTAFGNFVRDNVDDLPIIMRELRVGHCDLLGWYGAAALRAAGLAAWVITVSLPTKDGKAFNGSYLHSQVLFALKDGSLNIWDPTILAAQDLSYAPEILKDSDVEELQREYSAAGGVENKTEILRRFNKELHEVRSRIGSAETPGLLRFDTLSMVAQIVNQTVSDELAQAGSRIAWHRFPDPVSVWRGYIELDPKIWSLTHPLLEVMAGAICDGKHILNSTLQKIAAVTSALKVHRIRTPLGIESNTKWMTTGLDASEIFALDTACLSYYPQSPLTFSSSESRLQFASTRPPDLDRIIDRFESEPESESYQDLYNILAYNLLFDRDRPLDQAELLPALKSTFANGEFPRSLSTNMFLGYDGHYVLVEGNVGSTSREEVSEQLAGTARRQIFELNREFQWALLDPSRQKHFCARAGIPEENFWRFAAATANLDLNGRRARGSLPRNTSQGQQDEDRLHNYEGSVFGVYDKFFELQPDCKAVLRKVFLQGLRRLDMLSSRVPTKELSDARLYMPGDDLRRLDWKRYAKTDQYFVRSSPARQTSYASPLFVFFDLFGEQGSRHLEGFAQSIELMDILKSRRDRQIFIASPATGWIELAPQLRRLPSPFILDKLYKKYFIFDEQKKEYDFGSVIGDNTKYSPGDPLALRTHDGTFPENLLFISANFTRCLVAEQLLGRSGANVCAAWTLDPSIMVWPVVRSSLVT